MNKNAYIQAQIGVLEGLLTESRKFDDAVGEYQIERRLNNLGRELDLILLEEKKNDTIDAKKYKVTVKPID